MGRTAAILAARFNDLLQHVAKTGRNEPCPCGSGAKYKLCHGAVARMVPAQTTARQCGECTACCQGWAEGEIRGHRMRPGQPCHFLHESACTIYDERPQSPCRNFVCGWLAPDSPFPESFRPDRVGVIIVPMRWRDRPCHVLLSAGQDADESTLAWMRQHAQATGEPFYYQQGGERLGYGPPAFLQEMADKVRRGETLW